MGAAYRYGWASQFKDSTPANFDPFAFGAFTNRDATCEATVHRGFLRTSDNYSLPYRLWSPPSPIGSILLVHGACDYAGAFDAICPYLAKQRYAALAFDQRGFGSTNTRGKWAGIDRMARDIGETASFLRQRIPEVPNFIVGESMGAALTVQASAEGYINGISGLVLIAPGAVGGMLRRMGFALAVRALHALGTRTELFMERINSDELSADAAIRLLADPLVLRRISPRLIAGLMRLGAQAFDSAPRVRTPTLTLLGSRENVSSMACVRGIHHRFAGDATLLEFKDGPHMLLHWRDREKVLDAIADWIADRTGHP
jgi:alpha-beta hydrolase superfamily lysophospholipase